MHKLDTDKIVLLPVNLSKLSDVVKNDVVEKDVYNVKIKDIKDKIPDITNLYTNNILNAKINEVKNEKLSIANLITNASTNAKISEVKKKISNITNLPTDHIKYITTSNFNKLTAENFTARLKQANLANKGGMADFVKNKNFDD